MTGNGWLYKSSPTHLQAQNTDWWWHFCLLEKQQKGKKKNCKSVFHICKWWVANVPKAVLSTMKSPYGAGVPYADLPHGKAAAFSRRCLSSLTWGHDVPTMCACVRVWVSEWIYCVWLCLCFSVTAYCFDFWAQSTIHMMCAALGMAYVSVTVKPIGQDWRVWKTKRDWMRMWQGGETVWWLPERLPFVFHLTLFESS